MDYVSIIVVIAMVSLMLGALVGGLWERVSRQRSITHRFVQFMGLAWVIGATVILGVLNHLDGIAGTILGATAGYVFGLQRHDGTKQ